MDKTTKKAKGELAAAMRLPAPPDDAAPCVFCQDSNVYLLRGLAPENSHKTAPCFHRVCAPCEKSELQTPKACPACQARIVSSSLSAKPPSLLRLETQSALRGRICAEWNLCRNDFKSDREFHDYLEQREEIICEELVAPNSKKAERDQNLARYREAIARNKARVDEERSAMEAFVEREIAVQKKLLEQAQRELLEARQREKQRLREENEVRTGVRLRTTEQSNLEAKAKKQFIPSQVSSSGAISKPNPPAAESARVFVRTMDPALQPVPLPAALEALKAKALRPWTKEAANAAGWSDAFVSKRSRQELFEGYDDAVGGRQS